ncbi:hypothetical protein EKH57_10810 [Halorubrum sp. BOL3-1]|uniref:hypothetical protein n=1 Tax=Halorubrum sp. BOL3-1 TaxID=2497325 RepID=UPI001004E6F7|nr:hypothetical protein [Halorubrum sp. BOL3-1]QAU13174.1 hypothetical protein EKH57_10810 [Halorubrum sp. BOL3-1]
MPAVTPLAVLLGAVQLVVGHRVSRSVSGPSGIARALVALAVAALGVVALLGFGVVGMVLFDLLALVVVAFGRPSDHAPTTG